MLDTECTLKPYDNLKVKYKPQFNAVCTKQVFILGLLDSYDSKLQSLSSFFHNSQIAVYTLQLTYIQPILQSRIFLQVLH